LGQIVDITLGKNDTVWVTLTPCGGASCDEETFILFRVRNGTWNQVSAAGLGDLAFDANDEGWLCAGTGFIMLRLRARNPYLNRNN